LSVQKLRPYSFGAPRALATYQGILGDFDAIADWLSKAIGQHDPAILSGLRVVRTRPPQHSPLGTVMRKLNLPEA
jgi:hypothetical protein